MGVIVLEGIYPVLLENMQVGTVRVVKQGLYYGFEVFCTPERTRLYRLIMTVRDTRIDLGVCVPQSGGLGLRKKLPVKNIAAGEPSFCLLCKQERQSRSAEQIFSDKPIAQLASLREKALRITHGAYYITDRSEGQQDSDRNP